MCPGDISIIIYYWTELHGSFSTDTPWDMDESLEVNDKESKFKFMIGSYMLCDMQRHPN